MRVAYVTMSFPHPSETFAGSDIRTLTDKGVTVSVHSLRSRYRKNDELVRRWQLEDVEVTHNSLGSVLRGIGYGLRRPRLLRQLVRLTREVRNPGQLVRTLVLIPRALALVRWIESERPDMVHLFWGHYPALVGRLVQIALPEVATSVFLGAYDLELSYPLSRSVVAGADLVWTHSRCNVDEIAQLGASPDKLQVAYRGVDLSRFQGERREVDGRIVSVGRLISQKGVDTVLRAFSLLLPTHPRASLVLLGDGPERGKLDQLASDLGIRDRVDFRGRVHHDEVVKELHSAQVMLFLSHKTSERLPNAVKEAMACGTYCVVSRTPGIEELIPDAQTGCVLEETGPAEAAEAVGRALDDPELRRLAATRARRRIERHFDSQKTMTQYVEAWRSACESRSSVSFAWPLQSVEGRSVL